MKYLSRLAKYARTLRVQFALWTAMLLLAALTLFSSFVYINMAQSLAHAVDNELRLAVSQVLVESDLTDGELVSVDEFLEILLDTSLIEQGFSFRLSDMVGEAFQEYGPYRALFQPPVSAGALDGAGVFTTLTDAVTQRSVRVYTTPIVEDGQTVGIVQVAQDLGHVEQTLNQLLVTLLISGPLLAVVAGVGGYFLAARALAPIDKITHAARQISAKDLSARLNLPKTDDEAGRLAATFDSMLTRLEDAFRRERRFTADASHELRTPLSAMQTIISSTMAQRRAVAEYEQALIDLEQETEQMRTLTEGLLHLARDDAIRGEAKSECIDLSILLKDVIDSLSPLAEDKGLQLIDHVPEKGLTLPGDRDSLIRLFVNLLANAIKYTEQGLISISASSKDGKLLTVTISDTGMGITPEHLPHIFDRFYRIDASRSTDGSGLGLAIARTVARTHGGNITVESIAGRGSSFTVELAME